MSDVERFQIGAAVHGADGVLGHLTGVVVNPVAGAVTHLAVEPEHRWGLARLVPIERATEGAEEITLSCTTAEFEQLERAEETQFFTGTGADYGVDGQVLLWPYRQLAYDVPGVQEDFGGNAPAPAVFDRLPVGSVEVRRGDEVHATDGSIGRVQGLVIDPRDHHVTHVLLEEGHLWGRKEVAIPISSVERVGEQIRLTISKDEVRDLPPVDLAELRRS